MLSSFGENINLDILDPNLLNSLLQYSSIFKDSKESQNNENVMENFLNQLNTTKENETPKEENKNQLKNPEFNSIGNDTLTKSNEESMENKDLNNIIEIANNLNDAISKSKKI